MQLKRIFIISPIILSACIYGPQTEKKSVADYFNGKNYEAISPASGGGIPLLAAKRKNRPTEVSGNIYTDYGIQPLQYCKVALTRGTEVIAEVTTDINGKFVINRIIPNGSYKLEVIDKKREGFRLVLIESYELKNQDIVTHIKVAEEGKITQ
jgi:hypothetical protein